jgi:tetratricopeptide (TPR) repeat protein
MGYFSFCQNPSFDNNSLVKKLSAENTPVNSGMAEVATLLYAMDSIQGALLLDDLQKRGDPSDDYFDARFSLCKADWLYHYLPHSEAVRQLLNQALNAAFETENDSLVSLVSWRYGILMYDAGQYGLATVYCLLALENDERTGRKASAANYGALGDLFFRTQEYASSAFYTKCAIQEEHVADNNVMSWYNTVGLCWLGIKNYDSAIFYFDSALLVSKKLKEAILYQVILHRFTSNRKSILSQNRYWRLTISSPNHMAKLPVRPIACNGSPGSISQKARLTVPFCKLEKHSPYSKRCVI